MNVHAFTKPDTCRRSNTTFAVGSILIWILGLVLVGILAVRIGHFNKSLTVSIVAAAKHHTSLSSDIVFVPNDAHEIDVLGISAANGSGLLQVDPADSLVHIASKVGPSRNRLPRLQLEWLKLVRMAKHGTWGHYEGENLNFAGENFCVGAASVSDSEVQSSCSLLAYWRNCRYMNVPTPYDEFGPKLKDDRSLHNIRLPLQCADAVFRSFGGVSRGVSSFASFPSLPSDNATGDSSNNDQPPVRYSPPFGPLGGCVLGWRVASAFGLIEGDAKAVMLRVRISPAESKAVEAAAKASNQTVSEWIRATLFPSVTE